MKIQLHVSRKQQINTLYQSQIVLLTLRDMMCGCISVQFKIVSVYSEKPICTPPRLRNFPSVAFETVPMSD